MEINKVTSEVKIVTDPNYGLVLTDEVNSFKSGTILGACRSTTDNSWAVKIARRHSEGKPRLWIIPEEHLSLTYRVKLIDISKIDENLNRWLWDDPE